MSKTLNLLKGGNYRQGDTGTFSKEVPKLYKCQLADTVKMQIQSTKMDVHQCKTTCIFMSLVQKSKFHIRAKQ